MQLFVTMTKTSLESDEIYISESVIKTLEKLIVMANLANKRANNRQVYDSRRLIIACIRGKSARTALFTTVNPIAHVDSNVGQIYGSPH